jgi:hypothetical protein
MSSAADESRKEKSRQQFVEQPLERDVLLGRGKRAINWSGNVRFRNLVKTWAGEYEKSTDPQIRDTIANRVMAVIREDGGRFLQLMVADNAEEGSSSSQPNTWVIISEASARTKVKQALRDVCKTSRTRQKPRTLATSSSVPADAATGADPLVSRRLDDHSAVDLEPRPIEEIMRTSSGTMVAPVSFEALQRQQRPQQQQPLMQLPTAADVALQVEMLQRSLLPLGGGSGGLGLGEPTWSGPAGSSYYPPVAAQSSTTAQHASAVNSFQEILRRQQDILTSQFLANELASRVTGVGAPLIFPEDNRGGQPATASVAARLSLQPPDRQSRPATLPLYHGGGGSLHSTASSDHMIGRAAAAAAPAHYQPPQNQPSTVFLDQAIRAQLSVDQRKRPPLPPSPDDHSSTFDSFFDGHDEEEERGQELSSGDDNDEGKQQHQQHPRKSQGDA